MQTATKQLWAGVLAAIVASLCFPWKVIAKP
jgi:hypothetical protein